MFLTLANGDVINLAIARKIEKTVVVVGAISKAMIKITLGDGSVSETEDAGYALYNKVAALSI